MNRQEIIECLNGLVINISTFACGGREENENEFSISVDSDGNVYAKVTSSDTYKVGMSLYLEDIVELEAEDEDELIDLIKDIIKDRLWIRY